MQDIQEYHLHCDGMRIVFGQRDGEPTLQYDRRIFSGRELYLEQTQAGKFVTVELERVPDLHIIRLTLAIPTANLPAGARSTNIATFAIVSTERTTIAGSAGVDGQIVTYEVMSLTGNAW
ncbi:hypothetical protein OV079_50530 [Nannocystis pusilla]|uniref:Uncharacterized protein n=1 Tax=Nannocystis pusilla TaxID=889268 RepID=A0A9X3F1J6_9BACT|nr:hypothetical protein [Nannocystis pusilla]MCY1013635.1 hypothetical protein [Nannocystis pusilla]